MRDAPTPWKHGVVLVCANEREPGAARPSCGRLRGQRLRSWLKAAARAEGGPVSECRVLESSCLDVCPADGVAVALMPRNRLLVVDAEADQDALLSEVKAHFEGAASPRGKARRALGLLRGRD